MSTRLQGGTARDVTAPTARKIQVVGGVALFPSGSSQAAVDEAKRVVASITKRPDLANAMERANVTVVVIPQGVKMTDLPEFETLRGTQTFDGRLWDDVRGSGGLSINGRVFVGVSEENLAGLPGSQYPEGYSIALHELAHALHQHALPKAERTAITRAFEARKAAGGPWTEPYGASNELEYFAQATNAWFGKNVGVGNNGAAWLRGADPAMCAILQKIYGAPPAEPVA